MDHKAFFPTENMKKGDNAPWLKQHLFHSPVAVTGMIRPELELRGDIND